MSLLNGRLISEIKLACKKIKVKHLVQCNIIEDVFHIGIDDLQSEMEKYCLLTQCSEQLSHFLAETIRKCTIEELREKLNHLKAWGVATNKSRVWKTYGLLDKLAKDVGPIKDANKLRKELLRSFRTKSLNAVINVVNHEKMLWCAITGKKLTRRSGVKMEPTVFFCMSPDKNYMFTSKIFPTKKLQLVVNTLNYSGIKNCHLTGKDVHSLLKLAKVEASVPVGEITFSPAPIESGKRHIDFTQGKKIEKYADKCFDKNVVIQTFTMQAETEWRGTEIVPEMAGEEFNTTMEIMSNNIADTLAYYASIGIIRPPFPEHFKNIMSSGKNEVRLREKKS